MDPEEAGTDIPAAAARVAGEADRIWRANPIPVVIGALAAGLVIGLMLRPEPEPKSRVDDLRERLEDTEDYLRDLFSGLGKKAKKRYLQSSDLVKDTFDKAAEAARSVDVDDYVDPASKWFRKLFKR